MYFHRVKEITWLRRLVHEIVHRQPRMKDSAIPPTFIEIYSTEEMSIASNKDSTRVTKHIAVSFHHVSQHIINQNAERHKAETEYQVADSLTKPATSMSLHRFVIDFSLDNIEQAQI